MKKSIKINPDLFDSDKYDENKISESAEILIEADEIRKDEVLMKKIKDFLDKKKKTISSIKELREIANRSPHKSELQTDMDEED